MYGARRAKFFFAIKKKRSYKTFGKMARKKFEPFCTFKTSGVGEQ
jgi:hypothetical protein